nr:hypothetical protein [Tanacetum cinerariifolium]
MQYRTTGNVHWFNPEFEMALVQQSGLAPDVKEPVVFDHRIPKTGDNYGAQYPTLTACDGFRSCISHSQTGVSQSRQHGRACTSKRAEVYYECMEPFKSLMYLWVRNKSIAVIWLEKVVTPLIDNAIKGFTAAPAVLKLEHLKVDKARYE